MVAIIICPDLTYIYSTQQESINQYRQLHLVEAPAGKGQLCQIAFISTYKFIQIEKCFLLFGMAQIPSSGLFMVTVAQWNSYLWC